MHDRRISDPNVQLGRFCSVLSLFDVVCLGTASVPLGTDNRSAASAHI